MNAPGEQLFVKQDFCPKFEGDRLQCSGDAHGSGGCAEGGLLRARCYTINSNQPSLLLRVAPHGA